MIVGYAQRMGTSTLSANIVALRKFLRMNQAQLGEAVGSNQFNVSKWESKGIVPSSEPLARMAEYANVPVSKFINEPWSPRFTHPVADHQPTRGASANDEYVDIISLDLSASMGPGTMIDDFVEAEPVKFDLDLLRSITRSPFNRLRLVRGIGDSMGPTLLTGDRIMVDTTERTFARHDGIYWVTIYGAHAIKRLRAIGKQRILVISDNPALGDQEVDAEDITIEGRVIWLAREL